MSLPFSLTPYGPIPSPRQLRWSQLEVYGFLHFTVNTFTNQEWGYGDESPALFAPSDFDADQIVETAQSGGLKGLILTCKHHDGFCLWPSAYTEHSVKHSPWRNGQGDVVREISDACARRGLKFGVYLSPWDRNRADYGSPAYIEAYRNQLRELLGDYGPLFEIWFDGANGGDGFYGGARTHRTIDKHSYYDWERTWQIVREMQPDACIFSDAGPDIRWVGNENGIAGEPCWATLSPDNLAPGLADEALLNQGERHGTHWLPAECDVSIRPGWFYHPEEDAQVKSAQSLVDLYFQSVGRGASLLLNLPPDRRGQIPEPDAAALRQFHSRITETFRVNLAQKAVIRLDAALPQAASNLSALMDESPDSFWCADPAIATPVLLFEFAEPIRFNVISLREYLPLGQRIDQFAVDLWQNGTWVELAQGTSIGSRRLLRIPTCVTQRIRLRVISSAAPAALSAVGFYLEEPQTALV